MTFLKYIGDQNLQETLHVFISSLYFFHFPHILAVWSACAERAFPPLPHAASSSPGRRALQHQTSHEHTRHRQTGENRASICAQTAGISKLTTKCLDLHTTSLKAARHTANFVLVKPSTSVTHSGKARIK